ncbi:Undecaprenyl-diphosphatase BcrC [Chlamydia trachomatis]|nr:Undecaprenyl-diphosphatase BcrC [Chlamydia trachomatis]
MELNILKAIETLQNPIFDKISIFMAQLGTGGAIFILIGLLFLMFKQTRKLGANILISLVLSGLLGNLFLKPLINRVRPYNAVGRAILVKPLKDGSFPSGHTYSAFATAFSAIYYNKKLGVGLLGFAALMGFTRLYLFVHYPTDVLGGVALGYVCAIMAKKISDKFI